MSDNDADSNFQANGEKEDDFLEEEVAAIVARIYKAHLPSYLQKSWESGRGKWYEEFIHEQIEDLLVSEIDGDPVRLEEFKRLEGELGLLIGILGASFRILDHLGMHLRAQTFGQYELLPEDEALLHKLCKKYSKSRDVVLNPFF